MIDSAEHAETCSVLKGGIKIVEFLTHNQTGSGGLRNKNGTGRSLLTRAFQPPSCIDRGALFDRKSLYRLNIVLSK